MIFTLAGGDARGLVPLTYENMFYQNAQNAFYQNLSKCACIKLTSQKLLSLRAAIFLKEAKQDSTIETETAAQPLIQPTSTVLSYGTLQ